MRSRRDRRSGDRQARPHAPAGIRPGAAAYRSSRSILVVLGLGENPADSTIRQRVMDSYFSSLSVFPLLQSRVIGVEFSAPNPDACGRSRQRRCRRLRRRCSRMRSASRRWPRPTGCSRRSNACAHASPRRSRRSPTIASSMAFLTSTEQHGNGRRRSLYAATRRHQRGARPCARGARGG